MTRHQPTKAGYRGALSAASAQFVPLFDHVSNRAFNSLDTVVVHQGLRLLQLSGTPSRKCFARAAASDTASSPWAGLGTCSFSVRSADSPRTESNAALCARTSFWESSLFGSVTTLVVTLFWEDNLSGAAPVNLSGGQRTICPVGSFEVH